MTPDPLSFTVHSMPTPALESDRRTRVGRIKMLLVLLVCAAPVIASYFAYFVVRPQARTNYSELIDPQRPIPNLDLKGLDGSKVEALSLKGQWLLVVVAAGACDATCEKHLVLQRQLYETLGREKARVDKVWLVTDEAGIRPEVMRGINVEGGAQPLVLRATPQALGAWLAPAPGQSIDQFLYVVDPHGNWMMRSPADPDPKRFRGDIEKLLRASASWDEPGR